jgi:glutamate-1-semialdehyde 2,1-aminomutase
MKRDKSQALFEAAQKIIPGGVNSPVRAFKSVGGEPHFIARGSGSRVWDVDGNSFIDYVCSWGPLILGHAHPRVTAAVKKAVDRGTSFGAPTEGEVRLAEMIVDAVPSIEVVRLVNSGTEATMTALRLARGYTGRDKIVKFAGCYHGHSDGLLATAGSGVATLGLPDSPGVPADFAALTISVPFNNLDALREVLSAEGPHVAAVILEPVAGNVGVVPPRVGFLEGVRELTEAHGSLLIFDEVITGFRVGYGGAQERYGIEPDLTCLGKIIGGGFPVGAYGGRREIMEQMAPVGPIYQAGTLSGNPVAVTAGIETLKILSDGRVYEQLEERANQLAAGLREAAAKAGVEATLNCVGSMLTTFFTAQEVTDYASARTSDTQRYAAYFRAMLERGVYFAPSQFEAGFVSTAHSARDIEDTIAAAAEALARV